MEAKCLEENEDGSVDLQLTDVSNSEYKYFLDLGVKYLTDDERNIIFSKGILAALKAGN